MLNPRTEQPSAEVLASHRRGHLSILQQQVDLALESYEWHAKRAADKSVSSFERQTSRIIAASSKREAAHLSRHLARQLRTKKAV